MPKDERTFLGELGRGMKNATYLAKKAFEQKAREVGVGKTVADRPPDVDRYVENQTTDSNNR